MAVGITGGLGLVQAGVGFFKSKKAQSQIQNLQTPNYKPNQAISDYYQQALQKANTSPYASNFYQQAQKTEGRNLATGIGALQDRRSAVGNIGALVQGSDDAQQRAGVQAEGLQRQAFGQLGNAVNMQSADYQRQFEYNKEAPYEKQLQLDQAKAVAGSQMENAGFQNAFGALGSASQIGMLKNLYGGGKTTQAAPTVNGYSQNNQGLQYTGGSDILHPVASPGGGLGYINPNSYGNFGIGQ